MKTLSRINWIFERLHQIVNMEYVSCLAIIQRILAYIKEILVQEFSQFTSVSDELITDFTALFIVCAVVTVILLISSKLSSNYEEHIIDSEITSPKNSCTLINLAGEGEEHHNELHYDLSIINHRCGDGRVIPQKSPARTRKLIPQKPRPFYIPTDSNATKDSEFSIKVTQSQHSQNSQRKNKTPKSSSIGQTWLIRRTRSGQIYGKYPI